MWKLRTNVNWTPDNRPCVVVVCPSQWIDAPKLMPDGSLKFDSGLRVPDKVNKWIYKEFAQLRERGFVATNDLLRSRKISAEVGLPECPFFEPVQRTRSVF